jgi:lipopolysaccharide export system protein LptA
MAAAVALAGPLWGAASATLPLSVTADAMDIDAVTRVVTAAGRVRISDGVITATSRRATLYQAEGRGVLTGEAQAAGPAGVLRGAEITVTFAAKAITRLAARGGARLQSGTLVIDAEMVAVSLADDTVTAAAAVRVAFPPDLVATGARLAYRRASGAATLDGDASLQHRDAVLKGTRIDATRRWQHAAVSGPVWSRFRDIEVRSQAAEYDGQERKAIFTGDVAISRPGRVLVTDKATVWYATGRIVAEGQTRVRLEAPP